MKDNSDILTTEHQTGFSKNEDIQKSKTLMENTKIKTRLGMVSCEIISVDSGKPIMLLTNCEIDFPFSREILLDMAKNAREIKR